MTTDGGGYFLYHSIGQYDGKAEAMAAALAEFARVWSARDDQQWRYALGLRQRFIAAWEALIGAVPGTVTTAESVTAGVHALITALPERHLKGRRVLIAADCFPSLHFLLSGLAPRLGFRLDTVPLRQGASWVEDDDMIARWDGDVGLALLTWVTSTSSHRADLTRLAAHGRAQGSLIGVDITQAAGLLPFDVGSLPIDFANSTSLKWMCGTPGAGMLWVREELIGDCGPELRGWFSQDNPFSWALDRFAFAPDARRFDSGTPGIMAAAASLPAMEWHAGIDQAALIGHNRALSARLIAGADALGLTLASPRNPEERGGSVMIRLPPERPAPTIIAALNEQGVTADARGDILRLSPGVLTTEDGVSRAIAGLDAART